LDADGHLWVQGRISDRIVTGGVNVDPGEVEGVLRSLPGVEDAAVVGVPDPEWGEKVVAAVTRARGSDTSPQELARLVRSVLSPAKRPRAFLLVDALPVTSRGKVARERVRGLFR
jgi:acyl-CoA synthetase (AMP-forming)/AMP-acid ligase II